jgi:hypothetical protein
MVLVALRDLTIAAPLKAGGRGTVRLDFPAGTLLTRANGGPHLASDWLNAFGPLQTNEEPGCRKAAGLLLYVEVLELIGRANMRCLFQGGVDDDARNAEDR